MPRLSPRSIAHDPRRGVTMMFATHGKDKLLLELDAAMGLRVVRKVSVASERFDLATGADGDPRAVFWSIDKTIVVPLADAAAKARTIKHDGTFETAIDVVPTLEGVYGVRALSVFRFDGDAWTCVDDDAAAPVAQVVISLVRGTFVRALGGSAAAWAPLVAQVVVRPSVSAWHATGRCLIGAHGGAQAVIGLDGSDRRPVTLDTIWCSVGFERGFFAWSKNRVFEVGFDGAVADTGITKDLEAGDRCLFRAGSDVYFIQRSTVHRFRDGTWTAHDLAATGAAIGLG